MSTEQPQDWTITLRPPRDKQDPGGQVRLRRALKMLLRSFGLRCIEVKRGPPSDQPATQGPS